MDSNQRGACDRCRGQKLRCVGLSGLMPTFESEGRLQRNEKPCDRCRKAQVECYSVRPASRTRASISSRLEEKGGHGPQRQRTKSSTKTQRNSYKSSSQSPSHPTNEVGYDDLVGHEQHAFSLQSTVDWPNQAQYEIDWSSLDQWVPSPMEGQEKTFAGQDSATIADSASPPYTMRMIQEPSDYFGIRTEHDMNMGGLGSRRNNAHISSEAQRASTPLDSDHAYSLNSTTLQTRQICVQELTELNEALLRDKKTTNGRKQAGAKSPSSTSYPATSDSRTRTGPSSGASQYNIGRTLQHSHTFLHILQRLRCTRVPPADTRCSYSPNPYDDSSSSSRMLKEYNLEEARSSMRSPASFLSTPPLTRSSWRSTTVPPGPAPLDMPTLLSVICCYAYIVETYSSIFSEILECIIHSPENLQAIWTGLSLDGFSLDGHLTIQLECLLHITGRMLDKMEKILVGSSDLNSQGQNQGLLDNKLAAGLLDALYCYNDSADSGGDPRKELRIKQDMRSIQSALKCLD